MEAVNQQASPSAKITLFRSLFRGREDVYPRWYEHRDKSGYGPACGNEWVPGVCEKPRIKCTDCRHHRFLPVTEEVILWHLSGQDDTSRDFHLALYPTLLDETCFFLAIKLDRASWKNDAAALLLSGQQLDLPLVLERTSFGKGRIWLFFSEATPVTIARKLGSHLITETMEHYPDLSLEAYDWLIPNQDTLPKWSFGSLIPIPLQKRARNSGNSEFVNEEFAGYPDQWAFLAGLRKLSPLEAEEIVDKAEAKDRIVGIPLVPADGEEQKRISSKITGPVPDFLELTLADGISIVKGSLSPSLQNRLLRLAAFQNPEFYKTQALRLSTYGQPRIVACAENFEHHLKLPRGCLEELCHLLSKLNIQPIIRDVRQVGQPLTVSFRGELLLDQKSAAEALLAHDNGILSATTAFGKTVVAAWLISRRKVNTLILVHRRQLQEQWVARLATFLDLPPESIGRIGGGKMRPKGMVDVALIQSLSRQGDCISQYGHLIVDECHHLPAHSFEQIARKSPAKYVTGLTATLARKDGRHPIILMQCGPVRYRVTPIEQAAARPFEHTVFVRPTGFRPLRRLHSDSRIQFRQLYDELMVDEARNRLICVDVINCIQEGRTPVVLTERKEHLDYLALQLAPDIRHLVVLSGGMSSKKIASSLAEIPEKESRVLLATGQFIGEGFDDPRLDTLFLTLPISWRGTIEQYVGRLHRLHSCKREVRVYDYADLDVPMLSRMFKRRCRGYEAIGYKVMLPGSAAGGWPVDIPLPIDPAWNIDYAASLSRLIRDGVDLPLANLFAQAASIPPQLDGAKRARSASEAFLYRRLETLPQTTGRFRLNAELAIPFDGFGRMEVDLLCADARIAVELDGAQHFADADAYRRDRRKDAMLQENGYTVLRFLTEECG